MMTFKLWKWIYSSLIYLRVKRIDIFAPDTSATVLLTRYHIKASYQDEFLQVLSEYVFSCRETAGNVMVEAYCEQGDASIVWIMERWSSTAFYKDNKKSTATKLVDDLAKTGLVTPVETIFLKDLELLFKADGQKEMIQDEPLSILLFVDVKSGSEDYFRLINRSVMKEFRTRPGVLIFRLSQVLNEKTRFVIFKKFVDRKAFQNHLKAAGLKPVIKFLQTSIKEPPFEKGYHHLIEFAPLIRE